MSDESVFESQSSSNTVRIHRVFKAPAERVYRAVLDPAANAKWLPPHGFTCTVHQLEPVVGGQIRMTFTNFSSGSEVTFGGSVVELEPNRKIVTTDAFDDPNLPGTIKTTYDFREGSLGVDVQIVQENLPDAIPIEACYLGWQESLDQLAKLVEAQTPDL